MNSEDFRKYLHRHPELPCKEQTTMAFIAEQLSELGIEDMRQAAEFRGGKCLSATMTKGDLATKLEWECAFGHRFSASPALILLGGHWCEECMPAFSSQ